MISDQIRLLMAVDLTSMAARQQVTTETMSMFKRLALSISMPTQFPDPNEILSPPEEGTTTTMPPEDVWAQATGQSVPPNATTSTTTTTPTAPSAPSNPADMMTTPPIGDRPAGAPPAVQQDRVDPDAFFPFNPTYRPELGQTVEEGEQQMGTTINGTPINAAPQFRGYTPLSQARYNQLSAATGDPEKIRQLQGISALGYEVYEEDGSGVITFYDPYLKRMREWTDIAADYEGISSTAAGGLEGLYRIDDEDQMYKHEILLEAAEQGLVLPEQVMMDYYESMPLSERPFRAPSIKSDEGLQMLNSMGRPQLEETQRMMVEAGLLDDGDFIWGMVDFETRDMYEAVVQLASQDGVMPNEKLREFIALGGVPDDGSGSGPQIEPWRRPVYVEPDYAALREATRTAFGQVLGRDVQDYELSLFADNLNENYYSAYEAEVQRSRLDYENRVAALASGGDYYDDEDRVQDVDPIARLSDSLRTKYEDEIQIGEEVAERATNAQLVFRALGMAEGSV